MADFELDCTNLNCPMPIVKINRQIKSMNTGQTLEVHANDPAFEADIRAWIKKTGNELLEFHKNNNQTAVLKKS